MSKSLVGFRHTVCIFFLLECCAFALAGSNNFICKFISHTAPISFATVAYEPFHTQGNFPVGANFSRYLESGSPDPATANFYSRCHISKRFFPNFVSIFTSLFGNFFYRIIKNVIGSTLFTLPHDVINEPRNELVVIPWIWC